MGGARVSVVSQRGGSGGSALMVFSLHPCSQPQRGAAADLPSEGRRRPGALQAGAQPGRQQPRLPLAAVSAPDTHVEVRRRRRSRSPRKRPRLGARVRICGGSTAAISRKFLISSLCCF